MKKKIPYRNRSPHGWWVASYLTRAVWNDDPKPRKTSRCLTWEDTIILKATDREHAYKKALSRAAKSCSNFADSKNPKRKGRWVLEGLTSLLPIYEELADGAEIYWAEHNITPRGIRKRVKKKRELECFDDRHN
jgi:hypothetical protein